MKIEKPPLVTCTAGDVGGIRQRLVECVLPHSFAVRASVHQDGDQAIVPSGDKRLSQ